MENFYKIVGAVLAPFRYAQREIENCEGKSERRGARGRLECVEDCCNGILRIIFLLFGSHELRPLRSIHLRIVHGWDSL